MQKVIIISGGNDGLGKEIARRLTGGNKVIIFVRSEDKIKATKKEIDCDYEICDVRDPRQVVKAVESVIKKYKRIDVLVNNAGVWAEGELDDNSLDQIDNTISTNTFGTIILTKSVVPHLKRQKGGLIVNIISQAGLYAKSKRSVYNASKWAITGFTKSIQAELSGYGIAVTGLYPGKMNTGLFRKAGYDKSMDDSISASEVAKTIEFIMSFDKQIVFPEIGIKHVEG